jgi:hypothetical protein
VAYTSIVIEGVLGVKFTGCVNGRKAPIGRGVASQSPALGPVDYLLLKPPSETPDL